MGRPTRSRQLNIWMNDELVGIWSVSATGQHGFRYAETWLDKPSTRPLSLSLPLAVPDFTYQGTLVETFFDNLLPDSPTIRRRVQTRFSTRSISAFDLLTEIGRDCVGAVQLLPPDHQPENVQQINAVSLDAADVANLLRGTVANPTLGQREQDDFRISIAGAQEKTALLWHQGRWHRPVGTTPTNHIFKLPLGRIGNTQIDLSTSVENEWLCNQIVRAYGLDIAYCEIAQFEDQRVLVVERFDRRLAEDGGWWIRLPQEDMCQATATSVGDKYETDGGPGIIELSALLLGSHQAALDRRTFFKAQLVFWLLCATDGHAKNFSVFIEPQGRFRLTPLYDVLSAYPVMGHGRNQIAPEKMRMAMAVSGKNRHYHWSRILPRHWHSTAAKCGLGSIIESLIDELVQSTATVLQQVSNQLPQDFPTAVADPILQGVENAAKRLGQFN